FARPVLYLSMEANDPVLAGLEGVTFSPALSDVAVGRDDGAFSAVERIFIFTNGPTGSDNPQRQGLNSALTDGRGPLNVLGGIPTVATDYSPLWDANVGEWTADAIQKGYRSRLIDEFQILGFAERGFLTGPGGRPYGSTGQLINRPLVTRFLSRGHHLRVGRSPLIAPSGFGPVRRDRTVATALQAGTCCGPPSRRGQSARAHRPGYIPPRGSVELGRSASPRPAALLAGADRSGASSAAPLPGSGDPPGGAPEALPPASAPAPTAGEFDPVGNRVAPPSG